MSDEGQLNDGGDLAAARRLRWLLIIVTFYLVFSGAVGLLITLLLAVKVVPPTPELDKIMHATPPLVGLMSIAADALKLAGGVLLYLRRAESVGYVVASALITAALGVYYLQVGTFRALHTSPASEAVPYALLGAAVLSVFALRRNGILEG